MSFLAKLELDGETYNVLECKYTFNQNTDSTGKPQGTPRGGQLDIKIESNGKTNFIDWMLAANRTKDGKITFFRRDAMSRLQDIKFEKAFCINFTENFNSDDMQPLQIQMTISAKKLTFGNITFENIWKV